METVATLDMQLPALLLGDFNGTVTPARDYSCDPCLRDFWDPVTLGLFFGSSNGGLDELVTV